MPWKKLMIFSFQTLLFEKWYWKQPITTQFAGPSKPPEKSDGGSGTSSCEGAIAMFWVTMLGVGLLMSKMQVYEYSISCIWFNLRCSNHPAVRDFGLKQSSWIRHISCNMYSAALCPYNANEAFSYNEHWGYPPCFQVAMYQSKANIMYNYYRITCFAEYGLLIFYFYFAAPVVPAIY